MTTPHKHADLIKAWADGAEIEQLTKGSLYLSWSACKHPHWYEQEAYRIKPEIKPNTVTWHAISSIGVSTCWPSKGSATFGNSTAVLRIEINHNDPANPVLVSSTLEKP